MKKLMILVFVFCLGFGANLQAQSKDNKSQTTTSTYTGTGAEIEFEKKFVDFGTLKVGDVKVVTVTYKNIGKKPLILDDVISSCDCTTVEWDKAPVMPGKTGTIKATYTAKNVGLISKRITVLSNANTDRVILQLKGEVK
ncbi:MAG: DUF1573 domain-containing protein [Bacteroidales bacterium]|jgi:hypothetical protein|nr:DUF1573 domain-containing protein [Bacteroidales bacterium]